MSALPSGRFLPKVPTATLEPDGCIGLKAAGLCGAARAVDFYDRSGLKAVVRCDLDE